MTTQSISSSARRRRAPRAAGFALSLLTLGAAGALFSGVTAQEAAPAMPRSLSARVVTTSEIDVFFYDGATNEQGFKIERRLEGDPEFVQVGTIDTPSSGGGREVGYRDSGLAPNTTYVYRVRAYNAAGDSAYTNEDDATTLPLPAPLGPPTLTLARASRTRIRLDLRDSATAEQGFELERKRSTDPAFVRIARLRPLSGSGRAVQFDDRKVRRGTQYVYRARAVNSSGASEYSTELTANTPR